MMTAKEAAMRSERAVDVLKAIEYSKVFQRIEQDVNEAVNQGKDSVVTTVAITNSRFNGEEKIAFLNKVLDELKSYEYSAFCQSEGAGNNDTYCFDIMIKWR